MHSSFRRRLTGTYLLVISIILLVIGLFVSLSFRTYFFSSLKSSLQYESKLVADSANLYDGKSIASTYFERLARQAGSDTDTRVTIVDADGKVLGDSEFSPRTLENHKNRPEIYQALHGQTGMATRLSNTAKMKMLYVAVPFSNQHLQGVVRLARPLTQIEAIYRQTLYIFLFAILISGALTALISMKLADRFSRPLSTITEAVEDMASGNLKRRVLWEMDDELGSLATAVNEMASKLDHTIIEISSFKNQLEIVLDNTVNGILMVAADGRINYANPVAMSVLGSDKKITGRKHFEVVVNYDLLNIIDQVRKDGHPFRGELVLHNLRGKIVEVHAVPIYETEGFMPCGVLLVLNDISELKRLEQVRKDFVDNVSHELKTPVAAISGFAETLLVEQSENEHVHEFSSIIYEEAQRLKRLIDSLLELSRLESGKLQMNLSEKDMRELIGEVIMDMYKRENKPDVNIDFVRPIEPVMVKVDADLIKQVLVNLLDNAISYSLDNTDIKIVLEKEKDDIRVEVKDQGEGIPEIETNRVFERFYRVDKTRSRKTGGTGLGLSIVKHLVENHGGDVGVTSRVGEGSTFYFTLPRR